MESYTLMCKHPTTLKAIHRDVCKTEKKNTKTNRLLYLKLKQIFAHEVI